jgi:hypothetical protein
VRQHPAPASASPVTRQLCGAAVGGRTSWRLRKRSRLRKPAKKPLTAPKIKPPLAPSASAQPRWKSQVAAAAQIQPMYNPVPAAPSHTCRSLLGFHCHRIIRARRAAMPGLATKTMVSTGSVPEPQCGTETVGYRKPEVCPAWITAPGGHGGCRRSGQGAERQTHTPWARGSGLSPARVASRGQACGPGGAKPGSCRGRQPERQPRRHTRGTRGCPPGRRGAPGRVTA